MTLLKKVKIKLLIYSKHYNVLYCMAKSLIIRLCYQLKLVILFKLDKFRFHFEFN